MYSLGSTLCTLLTGETQARRTSSEKLADLHSRGVPDDVCAVIEQALDDDLVRRQGSAVHLGHQLQAVQARSRRAVTVLSLEPVQAGPSRTKVGMNPVSDTGHSPSQRRRWFTLARAAALVLAVAGAVRSGESARRTPVVVGEAQVTTTAAASPRLLLVEDFSSPAAGWTVDEDERRTFAVVDGEYRILVREADATKSVPVPIPSRHEAGLRGPNPVTGIRVEAVATKVSSGSAGFGVACSEGGALPYQALIDTSGWWQVTRLNPVRSTALRTAGPSGESAMVNPSGPNSLRLDCEPKGGSPLVTLYGNGRRTVQVGDRDPSRGSGTSLPVLVATAGTDTLDVRFDDVVVTAL